jgi:(E)-4-hydroxy-3-methylbut-2-enyl-diphosphate synthase
LSRWAGPAAFAPRRRTTREISIGDVRVGGEQPIRLQSMTTTNTLDTVATVDQARRMVEAGCEIVRITAPSMREAANLGAIHQALRDLGVRAPLVADIHYTPNAAMIAAEHVEKIRVNPGNYADKKKFEVREYSEAQWREEVERVGERFRPLVRRCKELGRSMRIGTNHGSLADRMLNRYGDTPLGMVESALEFLDVCEYEDYREVVFSMKASNTQVAIQAYRLLAERLEERAPGEPSYPFHLGVTEAGDGEDGRVKSAIGIGALLEDGIGDTIRVSLTEDPVREIPVAREIARLAHARWRVDEDPPPDPGAAYVDDRHVHRRRSTRSISSGALAIGGANPVRVELDLGGVPADATGCARSLAASLATLSELRCEGLLVEAFDPGAVSLVAPFRKALDDAGVDAPLAVRGECGFIEACGEVASRLVVPAGSLVDPVAVAGTVESAARSGVPVEWELRVRIPEIGAVVGLVLEASAAGELDEILVSVDAALPVHAVRVLAAELSARGACDVPIVLRHRRERSHDDERARVCAAVDVGAPLCDGIGDAVALAGWGDDPARALDLAYRVLQGARLRTSWTEFISCPSCGRTLFDLEETTARIKARTGHLKGVKIAIMGCIVNGPGEMADADFGYVGSGVDQVNLYVGQECVERKVPAEVADERLVALIREHGAWVDPA